MGSLILAGAAEGLGKGIVQNVQVKQEREERSLDRDHDKALQRMRDKSAMGRQDDAQSARMDEYAMQREDALSDFERDQRIAIEAAGTARGYEVEDIEDEQQHEVFLEQLKQYGEFTESAGGKRKTTSADGKWEMETRSTTTYVNGIPMETDTLVAREPGSPLLLEQSGIYMLPAGQSEEERAQAIAIAKGEVGNINIKDAEADLVSKAGTKDDDSSAYLEAFGYLPVAYYRKITKDAKGDGDMSFEEFKTKRFRRPTNMPEVAPMTGVQTEASAAASGGFLGQASEGAVTPGAGLLSDAATATAEVAPAATVTPRREPDIQLEEIEEIISMDESRQGREYAVPPQAKAGRWIQDMLAEKPWIKGAISRKRMGLPLTQEQIAELRQAVEEQVAAN